MSYAGTGLFPNFALGPPGGGPPASSSSHTFLSISSVVVVLGILVAVWMMYRKPSTESPAGHLFQSQPQQPVILPVVQVAPVTTPNLVPGVPSVPQPPIGKGLDGRYAITYGSLGLRVDPKDCATTNVWFDDAKEATLTAWNIETVPGFEDVYFIRSEERMFDKACDKSYLSAPGSCTGPSMMDRPNNSAEQMWKLIPSRDGGYEIQSVACDRKRWPSFMLSSGKVGGLTNTPRLAARDGSAYILRRQQG